MLKHFMIIIICYTLVGCCNFKLRQYNVPQHLKTIHISPDNPYEPFQREFRILLHKYKIIVLTKLNNTTTTYVNLYDSINFYEKIIANSPNRHVTHVKYILSMNYSLSIKDITYKKTIICSKELMKNNENLLMTEKQKQIIQKELIKEAANELINQIIKLQQ